MKFILECYCCCVQLLKTSCIFSSLILLSQHAVSSSISLCVSLSLSLYLFPSSFFVSIVFLLCFLLSPWPSSLRPLGQSRKISYHQIIYLLLLEKFFRTCKVTYSRLWGSKFGELGMKCMWFHFHRSNINHPEIITDVNGWRTGLWDLDRENDTCISLWIN